MRDADGRSQARLRNSTSGGDSAMIASADGLLGLDVIDTHGELVGELWDLVLDLDAGCVTYGVVALERLRRNNRLIAVPWTNLRVDAEHDCLCVGAERDWVEQAPSLLPDTMSRLLDPEWSVMIQTHFDAKPHWERATDH